MDLKPLEILGREVGRASDEAALPEATISRAKEKALAKWNRRSAISKPRVAFVAAFAAAVIGLVFLRQTKGEPAITYSVGPEGSAGVLGAWIAAGPNSIPVRFSEGTLVTLDPGARARVTGSDSHGATMLVERGRAHAKVVHVGQTTSWLVHAGPFDVKVVGTEFDVAWDPTREVFDIRVKEGRVVVQGPLLDGGRPVSTSEVLSVDVHNKSSSMRTEVANAPQADEKAPKLTSEPTEEDAVKQAGSANPAPAVPLEKPIPVPQWQKLAAAGKHKEALEAAEQAGFENILANSPAYIILELADEARFAGSPKRARQALLRARELGARGRTAYLVGKLAAEHDHAPAEAITWFKQYLEESPSGGLSEQALGRIVELEQQSGHQEEARKAAQTYLQRYPGGAYETLARRVMEP